MVVVSTFLGGSYMYLGLVAMSNSSDSACDSNAT